MRRERVSDLLKENKSIREIARLIPCAKSTVESDIAWLEGEWRRSRFEKCDERIIIETNRYENIIDEAWAEWQASKNREQIKKVVRKTPVEVPDGNGGKKIEYKVETSVTSKKLTADPKLLDVILAAQNGIRKLHGLDKPKEVKLNLQDLFVSKMMEFGLSEADLLRNPALLELSRFCGYRFKDERLLAQQKYLAEKKSLPDLAPVKPKPGGSGDAEQS